MVGMSGKERAALWHLHLMWLSVQAMEPCDYVISGETMQCT
jgi:hypothetical protein